MADRRMFSRSIVGTDSFLDMPGAVQALYFHLCLESDDDGFCGCPNKLVRVMNLSIEDLQQLSDKGWIIRFPSGVVAVTHWGMSNIVKADRYTPTTYQSEKAMLDGGKGEPYRLRDGSQQQPLSNMEPEWNQAGTEMEPEWNQNGTEMEHSIGSIGKEGKEDKTLLPNDGPTGQGLSTRKQRKDTPGFNDFWSVYPRKEAKTDAIKAWNKLAPDNLLQAQILKAIQLQRESPQWQEGGGKYIPYPATWLNGRRWEDEPTQQGKAPSKFTGLDLGVTL